MKKIVMAPETLKKIALEHELKKIDEDLKLSKYGFFKKLSLKKYMRELENYLDGKSTELNKPAWWNCG